MMKRSFFSLFYFFKQTYASDSISVTVRKQNMANLLLNNHRNQQQIKKK